MGVEGVWDVGDVVAVCDKDGVIFAKAVPYYDSTSTALLMGHRSQDIGSILGEGKKDCIFRPEDLVFTGDAESL